MHAGAAVSVATAAVAAAIIRRRRQPAFSEFRCFQGATGSDVTGGQSSSSGSHHRSALSEFPVLHAEPSRDDCSRSDGDLAPLRVCLLPKERESEGEGEKEEEGQARTKTRFTDELGRRMIERPSPARD